MGKYNTIYTLSFFKLTWLNNITNLMVLSYNSSTTSPKMVSKTLCSLPTTSFHASSSNQTCQTSLSFNNLNTFNQQKLHPRSPKTEAKRYSFTRCIGIQLFFHFGSVDFSAKLLYVVWERSCLSNKWIAIEKGLKIWVWGLAFIYETVIRKT